MYKKRWNRESVAGSVIQATGTVEFEDVSSNSANQGLGDSIRGIFKNSIQLEHKNTVDLEYTQFGLKRNAGIF